MAGSLRTPAVGPPPALSLNGDPRRSCRRQRWCLDRLPPTLKIGMAVLTCTYAIAGPTSSPVGRKPSSENIMDKNTFVVLVS